MERPFTSDLSGDPLAFAMRLESRDELHALWQEANRQVGSKRAPADDLPILVYGYTQGRLDQLAHQAKALAAERRATVQRIRAELDREMYPNDDDEYEMLINRVTFIRILDEEASR